MLTTTFILSGAVIAILLVAKRVEEKKKRPVFILNLISKGDEHARSLHHEAVRLYSIGKENAAFLVRKQLPRYSRSSINKMLARLEERVDKHFHSIRDSRLLKKSDGISEFFKNISEVEKGGGELHDDIYDEEAQGIITPQSEQREEASEQDVEVKFEIPESVVSPLSYQEVAEQTQSVTDIAQPKAKRARKPSTRKKLKVTSQETEQFL